MVDPQTFKRLRMRYLRQPEGARRVKYIIAVGSGKGGVGKSTVAANLALALRRLGHSVGFMDCDVYGPSAPTIFGLENQTLHLNEDNTIEPLQKFGLKIVSVGFMIPSQDTPLIWRGPLLHKLIDEYLKIVNWGALDFIVVDLPPGTGDPVISLASVTRLAGAIVVTTPQKLAKVDVMKAIKMLQTVNVPVLGIVENMSYVGCPNCKNKIRIFGTGAAKELAYQYKLRLLAEIPFIPEIQRDADTGLPTMENPNAPDNIKQIFLNLAGKVRDAVLQTPKRSST